MGAQGADGSVQDPRAARGTKVRLVLARTNELPTTARLSITAWRSCSFTTARAGYWNATASCSSKTSGKRCRRLTRLTHFARACALGIRASNQIKPPSRSPRPCQSRGSIPTRGQQAAFLARSASVDETERRFGARQFRDTGRFDLSTYRKPKRE